MPDVAVVGGGAAGFFGAIACAEANPSVRVTILEAGRQPLAKVRISGGGRCNVTHHCFEPAALVRSYPRGGRELRGPFSRFQPQDTVAWFARHGVKLKTEADGRMFPVTDDSGTIVDCLQTTARNAGVEWEWGTRVEAVSYDAGRFTLQFKTGKPLKCDRLLLATGGTPAGHRLAASLGHEIVPPVPSLFTFTIADDRLRDLAGVSVANARVRLLGTGKKNKLEQTGPVLITHWGLSGPATLKLSAWGARVLQAGNYRLPVEVAWLPEHNLETLQAVFQETRERSPRRQVSGTCPLELPRRLWQQLVAYVGIAPETRWTEVSKKAMQALARELVQGRYDIKGKGVFKDEFVTCGGVRLKEVDFKTMASRLVPGLHFAGEILDIDGITGGFNFQSAWTTGWLAGRAIAASLP